MPLEGLDKKPRSWIGGIYSFLGLRSPTEIEWRTIAPGTTNTSDYLGLATHVAIKKKTASTLQCPGLENVQFGPMLLKTRTILNNFFVPWNNDLWHLLKKKNVTTVPGYGLHPGESENLNDQRSGMWWWNYSI